MMDIGEVVKNNNRSGGGGGEGVLKTQPENNSNTPSDFVLQWGNRKRLRCMKIQVKNENSPTERTRVRVSRGVVRSNKDTSTAATTTTTTAAATTATANNNNPNFRRPFSPPPPSNRVPRNTEISSSHAMKPHANGAGASSLSPEREEKGKGNNNGGGAGPSASSETGQDNKKGGGGGTSSGSDGQALLLPKFMIALTNKEKEEDFMAFRGTKLPQRPKKRAKFIQRTLNAVSPGSWLCDLTLERYEVREKKISKKRPRGLKAMGNMDSDSE